MYHPMDVTYHTHTRLLCNKNLCEITFNPSVYAGLYMCFTYLENSSCNPPKSYNIKTENQDENL